MTPEQVSVLGKAVFITHDGLTVEGSGWLTSLPDHINVVEFRDASGSVEHLPPKGKIAFFGSPLAVDGDRAILLGAVTRMNDAMGRPGFFGVALAVPIVAFEERHYESLMQFWQAALAHCETRFRQTRHSDRIGYLKQTDQSNYLLRPANPEAAPIVYIRGEGEKEVAAVMRLWEVVQESGVTCLLWNTASGPYQALTNELAARVFLQAKSARDRAAHRSAHHAQSNSDGNSAFGHPNLVRSAVANMMNDQEMQENDTNRTQKFWQRTPHLRYARPKDVGVEYEDYLIGLIEFVNRETVSPSNRAAGDIEPTSLPRQSSGVKLDLSRGIGTRADEYGILYGQSRLLLWIGFGMGILLVMITAIWMIFGGEATDPDPPRDGTLAPSGVPTEIPSQ